ncbi:MAG: hypothetical protein HY744_19440 [Deltaproteobacteria bacterium]|nr:hypothetical protein [Deltaproteobacteria bacterium]
MKAWRRASGLAALLPLLPAAGCVLDRFGTNAFLDLPAGTGAQSASGGASSATSSGSGAGGANAGGAAAAGAGGSTPAGPEIDCLNGADDDGDDLADCDDPDCGGYECVPAHAGAIGFARPVGAADPCPAPSAPLALAGCGACACSAQAGTCSVSAQVHKGHSCGYWISTKYVEDCYYLNYQDSRSFVGTAAAQGNGWCEAPASVAPSAWHGCAVAAPGHCADGGACVPKNPSAPGRCVLLDGAAQCSPPYVQQARLYDAGLAQCACLCTKQSEQCAGGSVSVYPDNYYCSGNAATVVALDGACHDGGTAASYRIVAGGSAAICAGEAVPAGPAASYTLCCVP